MMNLKTTNRDSIIDELHRTRQRMAEKFGGDIAAILEDARKRQHASGHAIWQGAANAAPKMPDVRTEDEPAVEIQAALNAENQTSMIVPNELAPKNVKLINK